MHSCCGCASAAHLELPVSRQKTKERPTIQTLISWIEAAKNWYPIEPSCSGNYVGSNGRDGEIERVQRVQNA